MDKDGKDNISLHQFRGSNGPPAYVKFTAIYYLDIPLLRHKEKFFRKQGGNGLQEYSLFLGGIKIRHIVDGYALVPELRRRKVGDLEDMHISPFCEDGNPVV